VFSCRHPLDLGVCNVQPLDDLGVQHPDASCGDGAHGEFLMAWHAKLAHQQQIQGSLEGLRHFVGDRHTPARQAKNQHVRTASQARAF
jgi:hypothetical protein